MKNRISIAIATYNGDRFLREQLDSLYSQTILPDEVIVCDDASSDGTVAILEEYKRSHYLQYYVNEQSLGCNRNFIQAFSLCTGDYIFICDQDDIWLPNKIETLLRKISSMDQSKPLCVSSLRYDIDKNGNIIGEQNSPETEGWRETLLSYGRSQGCTMVFNRQLKDLVVSIAQDKPELAYQMYYDELVAYTAIVKGEKFNLSDKLMYYRHHDRNVVDPYVNGLTFRDKVRMVPTFYGFTIDARLIPMCVTKQLFEGEIEDISLYHFLDEVTDMMSKPNVWSKYFRLLHFKEISFSQRMEIAFKSAISIILKKLYHYPTA